MSGPVVKTILKMPSVASRCSASIGGSDEADEGDEEDDVDVDEEEAADFR